MAPREAVGVCAGCAGETKGVNMSESSCVAAFRRAACCEDSACGGIDGDCCRVGEGESLGDDC